MSSLGNWGSLYLLSINECGMYRLIVSSVLIFFSIFLFSCDDEEKKYMVELKQTNEFCSFVIPNDVKCSSLCVQLFSDGEKDYLAYKNELNQEILLYELVTGKMIRRIRFSKEGPNSIPGGFLGFHVLDLDNIYIPSLYQNIIYVTDTLGNIKRTINFENTNSGKKLIPFIPGMFGEIVFVDSKLYIPQSVNPMLGDKIIDESPVGAVIDTLSGNNNALPMRFPRLITKHDIRTSAGTGLNYHRCFDGNHFVYSFYYSDVVYVADINHLNVKECKIKSAYVDDVEVPNRNLTTPNEIQKYNVEHSRYGRIYYDKYRNVYYRIVYPANTFDEKSKDIFHSKKKNFSIIILDNEFNIIGETLFPDNLYVPELLFITKDGLFISTNNERNSKFDEDLLNFERIELKKF